MKALSDQRNILIRSEDTLQPNHHDSQENPPKIRLRFIDFNSLILNCTINSTFCTVSLYHSALAVPRPRAQFSYLCPVSLSACRNVDPGGFRSRCLCFWSRISFRFSLISCFVFSLVISSQPAGSSSFQSSSSVWKRESVVCSSISHWHSSTHRNWNVGLHGGLQSGKVWLLRLCIWIGYQVFGLPYRRRLHVPKVIRFDFLRFHSSCGGAFLRQFLSIFLNMFFYSPRGIVPRVPVTLNL